MSISSVIQGSAAAFGCTLVTVAVIWCDVMLQAASWYVPVSWLMIGLNIFAMTGIAITRDWIAATSFAITYAFLFIVPPLVGFHVGVEALAALWGSSIIIAVELLFIIGLEYLSISLT